MICDYMPVDLLAMDAIADSQFVLGSPNGYEYAKTLQRTGHAFTVVGDGGLPVACAGVYPLWERVGHGWAFLGSGARGRLFELHRGVLAYIDGVLGNKFDRIQTHVNADFPRAIRWAESLGFINETPEPMRKYGPDGASYFMFSRVA